MKTISVIAIGLSILIGSSVGIAKEVNGWKIRGSATMVENSARDLLAVVYVKNMIVVGVYFSGFVCDEDDETNLLFGFDNGDSIPGRVTCGDNNIYYIEASKAMLKALMNRSVVKAILFTAKGKVEVHAFTLGGSTKAITTILNMYLDDNEGTDDVTSPKHIGI